MNTSNPIWQQFDLENNLIKEYQHWMLLVRRKNVKLGTCVAILKRDAFPLSEVTPEEMAEYALVAREVETALKSAFNPHLVQHLALMFKDKQVHFHIIPRYTEVIEFAGLRWEDDNVPDPLSQKGGEVTQEVLEQIRQELKKHLRQVI